jgi:hypothetical protein
MFTIFKNRLLLLGKQLSAKLFTKLLAVLFILYLLLSYVAVNPIAKKLVPNIAEKSLASKASVGSVKFDPFRLKATINDFKLTEKNGAPLAGFKKLIVDFELSGMFDLAWKFKEISIAAPEANVAVDASGKLNWDALIAKLNEDKAPPSETIPRLIIESIIVDQGKIHYADADRPNPIITTLTPLGFQLKSFSTLPKDRGDYLISAAFADNGGILKWKGDMGVNPVASKGVVSLDGVKIAKMLQLVEGLALPIRLISGDMQTSFNYDFSTPKTIPTLVLNNMTFSLRDVKGELTQGGSASLTHVSLSAPRLDFIQSKQPELHIKALDFKLTGLNVQSGNEVQIGLKEAAANLPQLDYLMADKPQLIFQHLNAHFSNIHLQKDNHFSLALPTVAVNEVGLDFAENIVNLKEVVLTKFSFSKGSHMDSIDKSLVDKPLASLEQVTLSDSLIMLADQKISAQSLSLLGFKTSVIKNADQSLNWVEIFKAKDAQVEVNASKVTSETAKNETQPWAVALKKVALNDAEFHIQDDSAHPAVVMDIVKANVEVQDASLDMAKPLPIKAGFSVKQGGRFSANGQLWPAPLKADFGLHLSGLSLKPFAPYVNQFALLKLNSGSADASGKLTLMQKQDLVMTFKGSFGVKQFALVEDADGAPFLSWDHLGSKDLSLSLMPNKLHMATLQVLKPSGKFIIYEDKTMNVQRVLRNQSESSVEPTPESAVKPALQKPAVSNASLINPVESQSAAVTEIKKVQAEPASSTKDTNDKTDVFPVSIDSVRIDNGELAFADLSLTPQFGTNIHSLTGVINGLSTRTDTVSQVEMDGKVDEYGSARIRGALQPFNATDFTDIKLAFTNLDMSRLTPYSGKFAGRRIDSGKLSVDLEYKIKQHQLAGENKFVINKLKLGERVESADAADLPLDLAIAILEDSDGVIDLDLPITGSLDDPKFSYGSIVWKAIRNVLTKIVTAPFRALGKLFGGEGKDFDGIAFEAGVSEISPPELEKLVKVSEALAKRQGLSLGIVPSYHRQLDMQAIKEATFRKQVAEEIGVELEEGQRAGPVDLGNEKVQDAIDTLYNKLTKKGFLKRMVSKFDKPEDGHYEKAKTSLIASIEVTDDDLKTLAVTRSKVIQEALLSNGVSTGRVHMMDVVEGKATDNNVKIELKLDVMRNDATPALPKDSEVSNANDV